MNRRSSPNLKNVQKLLNIEIGTYLMKKRYFKNNRTIIGELDYGYVFKLNN
jgi:hypothetical protein